MWCNNLWFYWLYGRKFQMCHTKSNLLLLLDWSNWLISGFNFFLICCNIRNIIRSQRRSQGKGKWLVFCSNWPANNRWFLHQLLNYDSLMIISQKMILNISSRGILCDKQKCSDVFKTVFLKWKNWLNMEMLLMPEYGGIL